MLLMMAEQNQAISAHSAVNSLREEFDKLAKSAAPILYKTACRLCPHDPDTARDLVQNALVQGYTFAVNGKLKLEPGTIKWLNQALTNDFLQRLRKDKRLTDDPVKIELTIDQAVPADSHLIQNENISLLYKALACLSPEHQEVITLIDLQELDYKDAAEQLNVPVGTVRSRLYRARLKIAEAFIALQTDVTQ